jgi:hypothetical protein
MTKEELLSGAKFKYGDTSYYNIVSHEDGSMSICQFGMYRANVESVGNRFIKAFTFIINKRVNVKIDMSECMIMDQERNEEYQLQEAIDEYGIGAYEQ